jgi:GR25 family glycosyltransferase involved in LPS biosynthesis
MKAYILSVDGSVRSPSLLKTLENFGIEIHVTSGSTPDKAREYVEAHPRSKFKSASLNEYELACAYGHSLMHQESLNSGDEWAFFFEDDADLNVALFEVFLGSLSSMPKGLILLGTCGGIAWRASRFENLGLFRVFGNAVSGSHAYLADRESIEMMVEKEKNLPNYADGFARPRGLQLYVRYPFVAYQIKDNNPIILRESGQDSRNKFKRKIAWLYHDCIEFYKFGFTGGRYVESIVNKRIVKKLLFKLPGCRD